MVDTAAIEEYMRAANPIPSIDHIDADELARSATAVHARRATATRTLPETRRRVRPTVPRRHWRPAWAFAAALVLTLISVGLVAFLLAGNGGGPADESATTIPSTEAPEMDAVTPVDLLVGEWTLVAWDPMPAGESLDVEVLSGTLVVGADGFIRWDLEVLEGGMSCNATMPSTGDLDARQSNAWDVPESMLTDVQPKLCGGSWDRPGTDPFTIDYIPEDRPTVLQLTNDYGRYTWYLADGR